MIVQKSTIFEKAKNIESGKTVSKTYLTVMKKKTCFALRVPEEIFEDNFYQNFECANITYMG